MTPGTLVARQVTGAWAQHGEGPIWDPAAEALRWVDLLRGDVLSWRPGDDEPIRWHVGDVAAALRRRRSDGYVVATERGFSLLSGDGSLVEELPALWDDPSVRMNDGACDPQGRFFCGSMGYDEATGRGSMYRLDADHAATLVLEDLTIPNGLAFSPDGSHAFLIDSPTRRVTRHAVSPEGGLHEPVVLIETPDGAGIPDGMTLDAESGFWMAMWDGRSVLHYSADGSLLDVVEVPVSRPTACTFGGADRRDLYITSSTKGIDASREPAAGAVFVVRTSVAGPAEELYAG